MCRQPPVRPRSDATWDAALRSQAGGRKGDIRRLVTLALRNYLDPKEHEHALGTIRAQLREGLTPAQPEPEDNRETEFRDAVRAPGME